MTGDVPDDLVDPATPTPGCAVSGTSVTCVGDALASGSSARATVTGVAPSTPMTLTAGASVSGVVDDPNPDNNDADPATITVLPAGSTAAIELAASATTVDQGGSVTITATGTDELGNSTGDVSSQITLTSDVDTDVIDGNTVTFPTASPHVITATHVDGASASITIEVTPLAPGQTPPPTQPPAQTVPTSTQQLPVTGLSPVPWTLGALALILAGIALTRLGRPDPI